MDIILPDDWRPEMLVGAFDRPLFRKITSQDAIVARPWVWEALRRRYAWAEAQWRRPTGRLSNGVRQLVANARVSDRLKQHPDLETSVAQTWQLRDRDNKALERSELRVLEPLLRQGVERLPSGGTATVLDFTDTVGRYLPTIVRNRWGSIIFRMEPAQARQAAYSFPEPFILTLEDWKSDGIVPETVDIAIISQPEVAMRRPIALQALESVWTALRVGGSMIGVYRLDWQGEHDLAVHLESLLDATGGNAVLESFETIRNPATGRSTVAIMSYTKLGVPSRW